MTLTKQLDINSWKVLIDYLYEIIEACFHFQKRKKKTQCRKILPSRQTALSVIDLSKIGPLTHLVIMSVNGKLYLRQFNCCNPSFGAACERESIFTPWQLIVPDNIAVHLWSSEEKALGGREAYPRWAIGRDEEK